MASRAAYVVQGRRQIDNLRVQLDSLRVELQRMRATGDNGLDARRQLYARGVGAASSAVYTLLFNSPLNRETRDSIAAIALPVRNLFYAVEVGDMRSAFTETVTLLPRILPPMATIRACNGAQVHGCGRMGLGPGALRVAGFAADVSQASSSEEVEDAINRFLDQSGGAEQKQTGPPALGAFVNAYVGASGDCANFEACVDGGRSYAAHLPIGLELAVRTGNATPGHTFSLFFRVVELGGFLPREGQRGDRSTEEVVASLVRPGVFFLYAPPRRGILRHLPLSIGVGGTAAALRTGDSDSDAATWEWKRDFTVFVGWDIPLFP